MKAGPVVRDGAGTGESSDERDYDAIVIGSGFGGAFVAHELVRAGARVLMLERGPWVPRGPHTWSAGATGELTPYYSTETPYRVLAGGARPVMGSYNCVGGASIFYGGVSLRLRESDFGPDPGIVGDSGARWPFGYLELEPYYTRAERILGVAGESGRDPTEPFRSAPYPQAPAPASVTSLMIEQAGMRLGLRPFRLPLAIQYSPNGDGRPSCIACPTCDTYACAIGSKNDLASCVLPGLLRRGLVLRADTVAVRLVARGGRVEALEALDRTSGRRFSYRARLFILSAGALGSPHLLLASGLDRLNPAGVHIGRYLTRHCTVIAYGFFRRLPDEGRRFHKQIGFTDFYFGHPSVSSPPGRLGSIQQLQTPPLGLVRQRLPRALRPLVRPLVSHLTGLLSMAEDQPRPENRLFLDPSQADRFGLPQPLITHEYTPRDEAARDALLRKARRILREAGAWGCYVHYVKTFSHASGTVRTGLDPRTSPLDPDCRFRGLDNLFVADGSFMPTPGAVNPSLTIAANALRVGASLVAGPHDEKAA